MIVYGRHPVREVLRGRRRHAVTEILATEAAAREPWLSGVPIRISSPQLLDRTCGTAEHQGICVEAGPYLYAGSEELLARTDPLILALDELQDPHNLGAIARTAECAGADGLVICERRAAEVTPAVCKASSGAVEHLPIARVANLVAFIDRAKAAGCWCHGAAAGGQVAYDKPPDYTGGVVLVLGGRADGACAAWSRPAATTWSVCRYAAGSTRSTSAPPPPCSCTRLCSSAAALTAPPPVPNLPNCTRVTLRLTLVLTICSWRQGGVRH